MSTYRCNHCDKTVERDSGKRWIESYCETSGRTTRLWLVTRPITRAPAIRTTTYRGKG